MKQVNNIKTGLVWELPGAQADRLTQIDEYKLFVPRKPLKRKWAPKEE